WELSAGASSWFHFVNAVLHGIVCVLVVLVFERWLPAVGAVAAGLVFAVHPVHVEGVASVVSRAELLVATGMLAAVLAARRGWWGAAVRAARAPAPGAPPGLAARSLGGLHPPGDPGAGGVRCGSAGWGHRGAGRPDAGAPNASGRAGALLRRSGRRPRVSPHVEPAFCFWGGARRAEPVLARVARCGVSGDGGDGDRLAHAELPPHGGGDRGDGVRVGRAVRATASGVAGQPRAAAHDAGRTPRVTSRALLGGGGARRHGAPRRGAARRRRR